MELKGFGGSPMGDDDPPVGCDPCGCYCGCFCYICFQDVYNGEDEGMDTDVSVDHGVIETGGGG